MEEAQYEQVVISKYNRNCTVSQDYHNFVIEFLDKEKNKMGKSFDSQSKVEQLLGNISLNSFGGKSDIEEEANVRTTKTDVKTRKNFSDGIKRTYRIPRSLDRALSLMAAEQGLKKMIYFNQL